MMLAVGQPHRVEFRPSLAPSFARGGAVIEEREFHVLQRADPGQEIEPLEHEPDLSIADARQRLLGEMGNVVLVEEIAPGRQGVEASEEVHEGGLARARRSHHRHKLADLDRYTHLPEGVDHVRPQPVVFDEPLGLDQRRSHLRTSTPSRGLGPYQPGARAARQTRRSPPGLLRARPREPR